MIPHCPGRFESKTTSRKLVRRTYPVLQELYRQLQGLRGNTPVIVKQIAQVLTTPVRSFLYSSAFKPVGLCLEKLMADDDTPIMADPRVTLQTPLSSAQYFAAVILMHFYSRELLIELFDTLEHIDEGYSQFVRHFLTSILYSYLQSHLQQIQIERDVL